MVIIYYQMEYGRVKVKFQLGTQPYEIAKIDVELVTKRLGMPCFQAPMESSVVYLGDICSNNIPHASRQPGKTVIIDIYCQGRH